MRSVRVYDCEHSQTMRAASSPPTVAMNFNLRIVQHCSVDKQNNHILSVLIMDHPSFDSNLPSSSLIWKRNKYIIQIELNACISIRHISSVVQHIPYVYRRQRDITTSAADKTRIQFHWRKIRPVRSTLMRCPIQFHVMPADVRCSRNIQYIRNDDETRRSPGPSEHADAKEKEYSVNVNALQSL